MSRILLIHTFFDVYGGAEKLALSAARALKENGHSVKILTVTPIDAARVKGLMGVDPGELEFEIKRLWLMEALKLFSGGRLAQLRRFMAYRGLFNGFVERARGGYDLVMETQLNIPAPVDVSYIHYPIEARYPRREGSVLRRAYEWLLDNYASRVKIGLPKRILTNSTWTAKLIRERYGVDAEIVYPPVDIEYFSRVAGNEKREKLVVTVSRFNPEKGVTGIIGAAERLRDYAFLVVGLREAGSEKVIRGLMDEAKRLGLDNVVVEVDVPRERLLEYLGRARYYLHPPYPEHFGMSVVEAMAAGIVPIVYRDGGAWLDVVSRVDEILGYNDIAEVAGIIRRLDSDPDLYNTLRMRSIAVSKAFNYESFKRSLVRRVEEALSGKRE